MSDSQTPERWKQRDLHFEPTMTATEALMWRVESDPWLAPSGGMIIVLDRPMDVAQFRHRIAWAVTQMPRMRERVVEGAGPMARPTWRADAEFDLDYHVRHIALPTPGDRRQLFDLAVDRCGILRIHVGNDTRDPHHRLGRLSCPSTSWRCTRWRRLARCISSPSRMKHWSTSATRTRRWAWHR